MSEIITVSLPLLLIATFSTIASARFMTPEMVPVDRLVKNAEAYLAKHRNEPDAYYTLARIHYLAFSFKQNQAPAYSNYSEDEVRLMLPPQWMIDLGHFRASKTAVTKLSNQELLGHAAQAVDNFDEAIRRGPKNGIYYLGFGSLLEEFAKWNQRERPKSLPVPLQGITPRKVRNTYWNAFTLAVIEDSQLHEQPIAGLREITAYEAALALVRLSRESSAQLTEQEKKQVNEAETAIANFKRLPPPSMITPVVFTFQPISRFADLLDSDKTVDFDLRGYGPRETWPWVKPELGFLIWDPNESGRIESARQMFGGYTFQIFWRTGYDALRALDDNDDGILSGAELDGISVWFDRNGDGASQPDEVTPVRRLGVVSIAVTAKEYDDIHPTNPRGIMLQDGRVLRSWDWMVEPHTDQHVATK